MPVTQCLGELNAEPRLLVIKSPVNDALVVSFDGTWCL